MKIAVMQPYIFPYIGYFQLVNLVEIFVFYDDVNYIKGGWINRNRILDNKKDQYFTISCIKSTPNKLINEIDFDSSRKEYKKLTITLGQVYRKAPYFEQIFPLIQKILETPTNKISILAEQSIIQIANYLNLETKFKKSSLNFPETKGLEKAERLVEICKKTRAEDYINPIGGAELYNKDYFADKGINLRFLQPSSNLTYSQGERSKFIPWLSIIDVLMFNSSEEVKGLLKDFQLL